MSGRVEIDIAGSPCRLVTPDLADYMRENGRDPSKLNRIHWPAGASRWGHGRFLMLGSDLPSNLSGELSVKFIAPGLDIVNFDKMFVGKIIPLNIRGQQSLVEVELFDERYYWQFMDITEQANLTLTEARDDTFFDGDEGVSWSNLINNALIDLGIDATTTLALPAQAGNPIDVQLVNEQAGLTIDRLAAALGAVFVAEINGKGNRYIIGQADDFNGQIKQLSEQTNAFGENIVSGGVIYDPAKASGKATLNRIMPKEVNVLFPRYKSEKLLGVEDQNGFEENPYHVETSSSGKPAGVIGKADTNVTLYDSTWAIGPTDAPTNVSILGSIASTMAGYYFARYKGVKAKSVLSGWIDTNMFPGTVDYVLSGDGPRTFVDAPDDWFAFDLLFNPKMSSYPHNIVGLDGIQIVKYAHGGVAVALHRIRHFFPVKLTLTSGTGGDKTTQASYKYTAKNRVSTKTWGTVLTPEEARPSAGKLVSGDTLIGQGYLDENEDFVLWGANETLDPEACT